VPNKKHIQNWLILFAGLAVLYFATARYFGIWIEYLETHSLFLWSKFFWRETDFFTYCYAFFVQFFISRYLGALLITLAFAGLFWICYLLFKRWRFQFFGAFGVMMLIAFLVGYQTYDSEKFLLAEIELEAKNERWERVLELCTNFLEQAHEQERERDSLYFEFVDYAKFALCLTNRLPNNFFAYTKYFDKGTLFPDGSSTFQYMFFAPKLAYFYYSAGLQNMTMHQSFGCIVQNQSPVWAIETYLKALQIREQEPFGKIFSERLNSSLFHKNTARLSDSAIHVKQALLPATINETDWRLNRNMLVLLEGNLNNKFAFEYVMIAALTHKNHDFVAHNLDLLPLFDYDSLPKHFEESILADLFFRPNAKPTDNDLYHRTYGGFHLRSESIERIKKFMDLVQTYQNTGMGLSGIKNNFQDTYWFHFVFGDIAPRYSQQPIEEQHYG
jgi:hypothetical protein